LELHFRKKIKNIVIEVSFISN